MAWCSRRVGAGGVRRAGSGKDAAGSGGRGGGYPCVGGGPGASVSSTDGKPTAAAVLTGEVPRGGSVVGAQPLMRGGPPRRAAASGPKLLRWRRGYGVRRRSSGVRRSAGRDAAQQVGGGALGPRKTSEGSEEAEEKKEEGSAWTRGLVGG